LKRFEGTVVRIEREKKWDLDLVRLVLGAALWCVLDVH
jgi:hypothetical protein